MILFLKKLHVQKCKHIQKCKQLNYFLIFKYAFSGMSPEDRKLMIDSINIVFHSAASVRFDDPLKDAIIMNTRGCREVMTLCQEVKNLDVRQTKM